MAVSALTRAMTDTGNAIKHTITNTLRYSPFNEILIDAALETVERNLRVT